MQEEEIEKQQNAKNNEMEIEKPQKANLLWT